MSEQTRDLARQMVRAEDRIKQAALRGAWIEAQVWQDTRDGLQVQRSVVMRNEWAERKEQAAA